jgi:hypothetical protein
MPLGRGAGDRIRANVNQQRRVQDGAGAREVHLALDIGAMPTLDRGGIIIASHCLGRVDAHGKALPMDDRTFDCLTASLATKLNRRLLGSFLGTLTAALAWAPTAVTKPKNCPQSRRCGNRCCKAVETCTNRNKSKCVHHCNDGQKNRGETDEDCGGTCRKKKKCRLGFECKRDDDCQGDLFCIEREESCPGARVGVRRCFTCRDDNDCTTLKPRCLCGTCHECTEDGDCPRPGQGATLKNCVAPRPAGTCPGDRPCKCRECREDGDCEGNPDGSLCDPANGLCGECREGQDETDCPDPGKPVCVGGTCEQCGDDVDCPADQECTSGQCVPKNHCENSTFDPQFGETDFNCGGPVCPPCRRPLKCLENRDCISGRCDTRRRPPRCL